MLWPAVGLGSMARQQTGVIGAAVCIDMAGATTRCTQPFCFFSALMLLYVS